MARSPPPCSSSPSAEPSTPPVRAEVAHGGLVILANAHHLAGKSASSLLAVKYGADKVMYLSTGRDIDITREAIIGVSAVSRVALEPMAIGKVASVKINANIWNSAVSSNLAEEVGRSTR
jgi:thiamine biosynthesis protein ThiC